MPYYLTAKNGSKFLSIPIEDKHIYFETFQQPIYILPISTTTDLTGWAPTTNNISFIFDSNRLQITQGTGEQQRVGNKVMLKSVSHNISIFMNGALYSSTFSHGQAIDTEFKLRLMTVHFDKSMNATAIAEWFRGTYVPTLHDTTPMRMSNQVSLLRESTPYTVKFKILHDEIITISKQNTTAFRNLVFKPNKQITFDDNNLLTNDDMINTYTFIISPSYNAMDMDSISFDKTKDLSAPAYLFGAMCNTKYTYMDV